MKTAAIIQARVGSTRLPGKVLMKLGSKTIIEVVVSQVKKAALLDDVIVAASEDKKDLPLVDELKRTNTKYFLGSEKDVLNRYYMAAKEFGIDIIIRVCADQPLVDSDAIDASIKSHIENNADFTNSKGLNGWPNGTGCEVISFSALKKAQEICIGSYDREHIKPFFLNNPALFKVVDVDAPVELRKKIDLAVDTQDDYDRVKSYFERIPNINLRKLIIFLENK